MEILLQRGGQAGDEIEYRGGRPLEKAGKAGAQKGIYVRERAAIKIPARRAGNTARRNSRQEIDIKMEEFCNPWRMDNISQQLCPFFFTSGWSDSINCAKLG